MNTFLLSTFILGLGCTEEENIKNSTSTDPTSDWGVDTEDTQDTADTSDTEDTEDTSDTADTADTSDTADTGDTGDTSDTGDTGASMSIISLTFDDASSTADWTEVADATRPEASITWADGMGNPDGALSIAATNDEEVGRAYIFQMNQVVDYMGATEVTLTFDLKRVGDLTATAFHLQTNMPGVGVVDTLDIQNDGLNDATWTNYSYTFTGLDSSSSNLTIQFNLAAGAVIGAGGQILIDNIELVPSNQ